MSPLVRSLLALTALFATAATTQQGFPFHQCRVKLIGRQTDNERHLEPIYVPPPGAVIDIPHECANGRIGVQLVGVLVEACNNDPDGAAPLVIGDQSLKNVEVRCVDDCPYGLTVTLTEYCAPVIPSQPLKLRRH